MNLRKDYYRKKDLALSKTSIFNSSFIAYLFYYFNESRNSIYVDFRINKRSLKVY